MSNQDKILDQPDANGQGEPTKIGQITRPGEPTRQLATQASVAPIARPLVAAQRERIVTLVAALGDPAHPLHHHAVHDLVTIGDPAVSALNEALNPRRPWLASFRAAEALGQIGDGRATSPLIEALRHPNSNVRWGAVRALAVLGDARAMFDLRRVARDDRTKTTWGEPVAGAAESALEQMQSQNVLFRSAELIKTALACVAMLVALVVAGSLFSSLRNDLDAIGKDPIDTAALFAVVTPTVDPRAEPTVEAQPTEAATQEPTLTPAAPAVALPEASSVVSGTVLTAANVRAEPTSERENKIGTVSPGDTIVFLASTADAKWYRVQLGDQVRTSSRIESADGTGWIIATLLSVPASELPVEATISVALPATPTTAP
ncbi:MAG: HEAT repeat domain-containing protein [Roseiflexaceae bacterium]|nr:HEAT repeat domain-containing protein [Roseiflexaceae bacterium]